MAHCGGKLGNSRKIAAVHVIHDMEDNALLVAPFSSSTEVIDISVQYSRFRVACLLSVTQNTPFLCDDRHETLARYRFGLWAISF